MLLEVTIKCCLTQWVYRCESTFGLYEHTLLLELSLLL
jgi:hypothetical protein